MDNIHLHKVNESFVRIEAERSLLLEINDRYTFFVRNYRFIPSYKMGIWDGKIRLLSMKNGHIHHGLVDDLKTFAKNRNYNLTYDESINPPSFNQNTCNTFIDNMNLPYELRDYQRDAFYQIIKNRRHLILSPTGSGKSLIIYLTALYSMLIKKSSTLIIVPTTSLVEQMLSDFKDYSSKNNCSIDNHIHSIYSGKEKDTDKPIVLTTWQSVFRQPKSWFEKFETVICDEAHLAKAKSITRIMDLCMNANLRIGMTGTIDNSETHKLVLMGLFGPIYRATSTKKLMDNNVLSKTEIKLIRLAYKPEECKLFRKQIKTYPDEMKYLAFHNKRNDFICKLALNQKKNTLILFNFVDNHGIPLFKLLKSQYAKSNRKIYFISGSTKTIERENIRKQMESDSNAILLASYGTCSTGINIKNIHNIIFVNPTKSPIRVLQSIGRGLRIHGNNSKLAVYDIIDDFTGGKTRKNFALKHGIERNKLYLKEKFKFTSYDYTL